MSEASSSKQSLRRIRPEMRRLATSNRNEPTHPERVLWSLLRKSQLSGLKFRRQTVIASFIVDFCCPELMLIVEVDGESHVGRGAQDDQRSQILGSLGYRVLRFTNDDVLRDLESIGLAILKEAGLDIGAPSQVCTHYPPPSPLPQREGE